MAEERLSQDELALVLRRAVELDAQRDTEPDERVSLAAVEAGAAAAGVDPTALRRAVAELRAGMLSEEARPPARYRLGVARIVPLGAEEALREVHTFLAGQWFAKARDRDGAQRWRPREDLVARVVRGLDWRASAELRSLDGVSVRAVEVEEGALVRIEATLRRGLAMTPPVLGGGLAGAGLLGGSAALAVGADPAVAMWMVGTGTAAGAGGYAATRSSTARAAARAHEALEGFLDRLEVGDDARRFGRRRLSGRSVPRPS